MSSGAPDAARPTRPGEPPPLEWLFNPWREHPGRSALGAVLGLVLCLLAAELADSWVLTLGLSVVALGSLAPSFAPARCRMDPGGAGRRGPLGWNRREWRDIRRAVARSRGVLLSGHRSTHWTDPYRALFLPFPRERSHALHEAVRLHLARHGL